MENLQPAILNFMLEESRQHPHRIIALELISKKYGIDLSILLSHVNAVGSDGSIEPYKDSSGHRKTIAYSVPGEDNVKAPKGLKELYIIDEKKMEELIAKIKKS